MQNRLAAAHKRYGLSEIMGDLSRKGAAGTLSHFTLSYQNFALPLHGLPVRYAMHFGGAMTNLLTLHILDWGGNGDYRFQLDYRAAYYTPHEIAQTAQMLCTILDQGIAGCTQPCRMIELLSDGDKLCQRALLSGPVLPVDPEATIISRFRAQAAKHPDRRALSGKGTSYTFQELDEVSRPCRTQPDRCRCKAAVLCCFSDAAHYRASCDAARHSQGRRSLCSH